MEMLFTICRLLREDQNNFKQFSCLESLGIFIKGNINVLSKSKETKLANILSSSAVIESLTRFMRLFHRVFRYKLLTLQQVFVNLFLGKVDLVPVKRMSIFMRRFSTSTLAKKSRKSKAGVLCDIDGVLLRGREVLTGARESLKALYELDIPTIFLTNQGLQSEEEKAQDLSQKLEIKVKSEQVVLSQSPLRLFPSLHDKFVLVVGQRNIQATASSVGFKNICQIEDIQAAYPLLDMIDKDRRYRNLQNEKKIPKVEGILLLGEPIKWESILQLVTDLLVSNGDPSVRLPYIPKKNIPVIGCNTDLLWMAEAPIPRFGHGAFLACLESVYEKITGSALNYTVLTGKPFLITFQYAEKAIRDYLEIKDNSSLQRVYVIGDNPDTDIFGGNLYKQHVQKCQSDETDSSLKVLHLENNFDKTTVKDVTSILVRTGVYSKESVKSLVEKPVHVHKDVNFDSNLRKPDHTVENIKEAVQFIVKRERTLDS